MGVGGGRAPERCRGVSCEWRAAEPEAARNGEVATNQGSIGGGGRFSAPISLIRKTPKPIEIDNLNKKTAWLLCNHCRKTKTLASGSTFRAPPA